LAELTVAGEADESPEEAPGDGAVDDRGFRGLLPELTKLADEHTSEESVPTVASFLAWLAANDACSEASHRAVGEDAASPDDAVELMTFHRAKGLEWPAVAVIGLEDGIVPITYAATHEALAEERRLFYVALTRAENELWCSWARSGRLQGKARPRDRSPFLDAVEEAVRSDLPTDDIESRRARVKSLRAHLTAAG